MQYIPYILFLLAGMFNAVSETLSFHYKTSIFQTLNPNKWNPNINWMYMKNFLGIMRIDGYHISKTLMLICLMFAVYFHKEPKFIDLPIIWVCWFVGFETIWRLLARPFMETPKDFL